MADHFQVSVTAPDPDEASRLSTMAVEAPPRRVRAGVGTHHLHVLVGGQHRVGHRVVVRRSRRRGAWLADLIEALRA